MKTRNRLKLVCVMVSCLATGGQVFAQAQVVDAASDRASNASQQTRQTTGSNQNEIMVEMYLQIESLKNEIQNLRGLVEEQSYQIRRMQAEQRDRYLDVDSRLSELFSYHAGQQPAAGQPPQGIAPGQTTPSGTGNEPTEFPIITESVAAGANTAAAVTPRNEPELYRQALSLLLEDEAFQDSADLFQQYIDTYPEGRYFTNALYWQGAALHLLGNYSQSIAVLQRLLDNHPEDAKAPTAMLRLGTVYNEMGDTARAVDYWQRIRSTYPESVSEIELASEYLGEAGI